MPNKRTLSQWRKAKKHTQESLAYATGLSVKTITSYENKGLQSATLGNINKILKELNITIDQVDLT